MTFDYSQVPKEDLALLKVGLQAIILEAEGECHPPIAAEIEACHVLLEKISDDCERAKSGEVVRAQERERLYAELRKRFEGGKWG